MAFELVAKLKEGFTLKDMALEIQALNQYVGQLGINPETGADWFPRPISCNPNSTNAEGFVGDGNGPPDEKGRFIVQIANYEYIDWSVMPAQPQTFSIISGIPSTVARFA